MQDPFMQEVARTFAATRDRLLRRLHEPENTSDVVDDELRGLYHGLFVILDGGSALAERGLITVVDEAGQPFDRFLHEICLEHWVNDVERPGG